MIPPGTLKSIGNSIANLEENDNPVSLASLLRVQLESLRSIADALSLEQDSSLLQKILVAVCSEWVSISPSQIIGRGGRWHPLAIARQTAMALYHELSGFTMRSVGAAFDRRDHGTVLLAIRSVNAARDTNKDFLARYDRIRAQVLMA